MKKSSLLVFSFATMLAFAACSKIENASEMEDFTGISTEAGDSALEGSKLLILNEGAYPGASTIDVLNLSNGLFYADIFGQANPEIEQGLGNTGNDMALIGTDLWVLLNASNQVAVLDAQTYKLKATIEIDSPRSIVSKGKYAYISSYGAAVYGGDSTPGYVCRINVSNYKYDVLTVGCQPEGLAILDGKLYVANSGGYNFIHEDTVHQIDLSSFKLENTFELPVTNLNMMREAAGKLWISTYGESSWTQDAGGNWIQSVSAPMSLLALSPDGKGEVIQGVHAEKITENDGIIYAMGNNAEMSGGYDYCLYKVTASTSKVEAVHFALTDLCKVGYPYAILVNPSNGDILIADASFTGDSTLYCFDGKDYKCKWSVTTGVGTGHLLIDQR